MYKLRSFLLIVITTLTGVHTTHLANAQTERAVYLQNNTYLYGAVFGQSPTFSNEGAVTYWYAALTKRTGTIVATYPTPGVARVGFLIQHYQDGPTMRMLFQASNRAGGRNLLRISAASMPYDANWHHVMVRWSVLTGHVLYAVDGVPQPWDDVRSINNGVPFNMLAYGSMYQIGADLNASLVATDFYTGALSTVFAYIQNDASTRAGTVGGTRQGTAFVKFDNFGNIVGFGPLDLGDNCKEVYGDELLPDLCQRGGVGSFRFHTWGQFTVVGALLNAPTSPWTLWQ